MGAWREGTRGGSAPLCHPVSLPQGLACGPAGRGQWGCAGLEPLPPDAGHGRPAQSGSHESPALPSSHSSWGSACLRSGQVCPKTPAGPSGVRRNSSPQWWETVVSQSRNQNCTQGKTGRVHEKKKKIKPAEKGFAFNTHSVLLSLSQEIILSSLVWCQMFAQNAHGGLHHRGAPDRAGLELSTPWDGPGPPAVGSADVQAQTCPLRGEGPPQPELVTLDTGNPAFSTAWKVVLTGRVTSTVLDTRQVPSFARTRGAPPKAPRHSSLCTGPQPVCQCERASPKPRRPAHAGTGTEEGAGKTASHPKLLTMYEGKIRTRLCFPQGHWGSSKRFGS